VWSVTDVASPALTFEAGPANTDTTPHTIRPCALDDVVRGEVAALCGAVAATSGAGSVRYALFTGDHVDVGDFDSAPIRGTGIELGQAVGEDATAPFLAWMTERVPDDATLLLVEVLDANGNIVAAGTERLLVAPEPTTGPSSEPTGHVDEPALTDEVAATRTAILDAARAGSYEQLRSLIPDNGFTFTYGEEGQGSTSADRAIAYWKEQGFEPLRIMAALLEMPYTTVPVEGGVIYAWPAIVGWTPEQLRRIDEVAPEWRSALGQIYPNFDEALQGWIDYGSYVGWRIGIADDGRWMYFVAGD
jgi:hypothetical protein